MSDTIDQSAALRELPSVDQLLNQPSLAGLRDEYPRAELVRCIRLVLDERRDAIRSGRALPTAAAALALGIHEALYRRTRPSLRRVINATGIVLHTGLGRAPLAPAAVEAVAEVAGAYSNLEYELESGRRGDRHAHVRELIRELTGAEDALLVNNNAAATFLALNTLAAGKGAVISRGQLVEIGGSYRMPDIMSASGCRMIEVGATNRTRIADYERAIDAETAVLLRVHTSNYRIRGFTEEAPLAELVQLARRHDLRVIDDLGSGLLNRDLDWPTSADAPAGPELWDEPTVRESIRDGADVTLFSGDKLLGGPQAGVIVGKSDLLSRIRKNPLMRTFRPDKMTIAAFEATLRLYRDPGALRREAPIYRMLSASAAELEPRAQSLARDINEHAHECRADCGRDESEAGGGSLPTWTFPTCVVRVRHPHLTPHAISAALRNRELPIICRISDDALVLDCRTIQPQEFEQVAPALAEAVREAADQ